MNLAQTHCLTCQAATLDFFLLDITKSREFVTQEFVLNYKFLVLSSYFTASQNGTTSKTD
jgi:hypothetical protein